MKIFTPNMINMTLKLKNNLEFYIILWVTWYYSLIYTNLWAIFEPIQWWYNYAPLGMQTIIFSSYSRTSNCNHTEQTSDVHGPPSTIPQTLLSGSLPCRAFTIGPLTWHGDCVRPHALLFAVGEPVTKRMAKREHMPFGTRRARCAQTQSCPVSGLRHFLRRLNFRGGALSKVSSTTWGT